MLPLSIYQRITNINKPVSESESKIAQARIILTSLPPYQNSRYIGLQRIIFTEQFFHRNMPVEDEEEKTRKEGKHSKKVKKKEGKRKQRSRIKDVTDKGNKKQKKQ
jgi:hypothetical protein